ncbi:MAG: prepilin-type N-terminal cleavage/methylation domain-containing protein [Candidatus Moranbacteria bacterium]|nr:prepilin-type N-terminal cleavage/methylation domain-containing protein [Candidatus Moranbacteria bacterium]
MQKERNKIISGFTLVETLVALAIFTLGIAATVLVFSKTIKNKAYALEMGKSSFVVSRSMGDLIGYLRRVRQSDAGAYPIVTANSNELVVYSDYDKDGKTERLRISLSGGKVYLEIRRPSTTFPKTYAADYESPIELAKQIVNDSINDPMFSYYNKDYPADTINNPVDVPADVSQIRLIKIFLKINIDPNRAPDNIQQQSFVELRNLNDYDRIY